MDAQCVMAAKGKYKRFSMQMDDKAIAREMKNKMENAGDQNGAVETMLVQASQHFLLNESVMVDYNSSANLGSVNKDNKAKLNCWKIPTPFAISDFVGLGSEDFLEQVVANEAKEHFGYAKTFFQGKEYPVITAATQAGKMEICNDNGQGHLIQYWKLEWVNPKSVRYLLSGPARPFKGCYIPSSVVLVQQAKPDNYLVEIIDQVKARESSTKTWKYLSPMKLGLFLTMFLGLTSVWKQA